MPRLPARKATAIFLLAIVTLIAGIYSLDHCYPLKRPQDSQLFGRVVVDSDGNPLRGFPDEQGIWRYPVTLDEVSPLYIEALLAYEDRWFWQHPGFNPIALIRAAYLNWRHGRIISGGSTLSMQVARLLHPHPRTLKGKATQLLRTLQLEWHFTKEEILTLYLNIAPFGGTIEGVQAASFTYLNKSATELSHAEAALLAVLPQSPTRYRPDLHPQVATHARNKVLERMRDRQYWSSDIVESAKIEIVSPTYRPPSMHAPLLARRLINTYPHQHTVQTTIDGTLQKTLADYIASYQHQLPQKSSAAVLVVDNKTAAVRAYLGTARFADNARFGHVDMAQAIRSPGSTLKPFLYGLAMDAGMIHSHSLLADVPRSLSRYRPGNFDEGFSGPVSAASALQRSLNPPAVDLLERLGPQQFIDSLAGAGVDLKIPGDKPNLSVILGGAGTSLEHLVSLYASLAREGKTTPLRYLKHELQTPLPQRHLLSKESAWVIYRLLANISRPGALNTHSRLVSDIDKPALAWKTGTSYGFRDTWAIGVNRHYTIGVWIGRPDGTPLPGHNGRLTAGPLLFAIADHLYEPGQTNHLPQPKSVTRATICWPLGTLANQQPASHCHQQHLAWVIKDTVPPTWHRADSDHWQPLKQHYWVNPTTGLRVSYRCGIANLERKTLALWPKLLGPWQPKRYQQNQQLPPLDPACSIQPIDTSQSLKITSIIDNSRYSAPGHSQQPPLIQLQAAGVSGTRHWYINGNYIDSGDREESITHRLTTKGKHQIVVVDDSGNLDKVEVSLL